MKRFGTLQDDPQPETTATIDLSPLLDMVFLLLIFFMTTTVFVHETGLELERPQASTAQPLEPTRLQLAITADNRILHDRPALHLDNLDAELSLLLDGQTRPVVVLADRQADAGILVAVIDRCKLAGATSVAVAATAAP